METICLQCGNKGYDNAFVFCVKCVEYAVHRYCLHVIPEDFDQFVRWVCDDCEAEQQTRMVSTRKNFEKDDTVSIETEKHVYEDFPQHLYDACTKFDLVECPKAANKSSREEFIGLNNEENEKIEQNSQQFEQGEDQCNKTQQEKLSDFISLYANMKKKRSKIKKYTMKEDSSNSSKKPRADCKSIDVSKHIKSASDDPIPCEVKEKKISELRMTENPMLSCNMSSKSSKKKKKKKKEKTLLSLEANLEEKNQEHNRVQLENHCVGTRMEGGVTCTSIEAMSDSSGPAPSAIVRHGIEAKPVQSVKFDFPEPTDARFADIRALFDKHIQQLCHMENGGLEDGKDVKFDFPEPTDALFSEIQASMDEQNQQLCHMENGGLEVGKEFPKGTDILECPTCAEPIIKPIWSGSFNLSGKRHDILDGLKGHVSSKACQKVYEELRLFQPDLHLKMLPQSDVWPKRFESSDPNEEDIAIFFFPSEMSEPAYDQLIDEMRYKDLALKGIVQNAEILVFTSMVLPLMYWRFNEKYYLWGVFRTKQPPSLDPNSHTAE